VGENEDVITLLDEQGVEHEFSIVDVLEVREQRYAILQPLEAVEEPDSAVIFRLEGDALVTIEDDAEFERVRAAFEADSETGDGEPSNGAGTEDVTGESGTADGDGIIAPPGDDDSNPPH
jgi:uncharacterized protein YrzB (UPF0473 family)